MFQRKPEQDRVDRRRVSSRELYVQHLDRINGFEHTRAEPTTDTSDLASHQGPGCPHLTAISSLGCHEIRRTAPLVFGRSIPFKDAKSVSHL